MTRNEYLQELSQALSFLDENTRNNTVAFYAEMLDDRIEEGMTEEAATADMERIETIAARLRGEYQSAPKVDAVLESYVRQEVVLDGSDISDITISASNMPVVVTPSNNSQVKLVYYTSEQDKYTVSCRNGHLSLTHVQTGAIVNFTGLMDALRMAFGKRVAPTIELNIPKDLLVDLSVSTSNGSISLENLSSLCNTTLRTTNGRITLLQLSAKLLQAQSSNGRVQAENLKLKQSSRIQTSNARIEALRISCEQDLTISTSNGRANADHVHAVGQLSITTSNGAINSTDIKGSDITLRTSNGRITANMPGRQSDYAIQSSTSNGNNNLPKNSEGMIPLSVRTSNGAIDVNFAG